MCFLWLTIGLFSATSCTLRPPRDSILHQTEIFSSTDKTTFVGYFRIGQQYLSFSIQPWYPPLILNCEKKYFLNYACIFILQDAILTWSVCDDSTNLWQGSYLGGGIHIWIKINGEFWILLKRKKYFEMCIN